MKNLEQIYKKQSQLEKEVFGDDFRSHQDIIYEAITEFVLDYLGSSQEKWTLNDAINEILYMGLENEETIIAIKSIMQGYENKWIAFKEFEN